MSTAATNPITGRKLGQPFYFPEGLPGLEDHHRFYLEPIPNNRLFLLLQSAEDEQVGMVLVDPLPFFPDYHVEILKIDMYDLAMDSEEDILTLSTVTFNEEEMYTNLAAPILINLKTKRGKQIIMPHRVNDMRTPLMVSTGEEDPADESADEPADESADEPAE